MLAKLVDYVEVKTKITSTFTFTYVLAYLSYQGVRLRPLRCLVFFISMLLFDLTTTAINNYIDTRDNGQALGLNRRLALGILWLLLLLSVGFGLYLVWLTDWLVLAAGALCFACGILYTYGPIPISRQPLGELFSGFFFGYGLLFILMYINLPAGALLSYRLSVESLQLQLNFLPLLRVALLGLIPFCVTANIMLANNICDLEKDITVRRFTLPFYLGRQRSLRLFALLYLLCYADNLLMVAWGMLPFWSLLVWLTLWPVRRNIRIFSEQQVKQQTFVCSIRNFVLVMGAHILTLLMGLTQRALL